MERLIDVTVFPLVWPTLVLFLSPCSSLFDFPFVHNIYFVLFLLIMAFLFLKKFKISFLTNFTLFLIVARRSSLGLKVALVLLHLIYVGILFLFDNDLIDKIKEDPWYVLSFKAIIVAFSIPI